MQRPLLLNSLDVIIVLKILSLGYCYDEQKILITSVVLGNE